MVRAKGTSRSTSIRTTRRRRPSHARPAATGPLRPHSRAPAQAANLTAFIRAGERRCRTRCQERARRISSQTVGYAEVENQLLDVTHVRHAYSAAVFGCMAHAAALAVGFFAWMRANPRDYPSFAPVLLLAWLAWGAVLWIFLGKRTKRALIIPMACGLMLLSPVWLTLLALLCAPVPQ